MVEPAEESVVAPCMLQAALDLAEQSLRIFPVWHVDPETLVCCCPAAVECDSPGKHPRIERWQVLATDDAAQVREWWTAWPDASAGLVTGATNGFVVADFDPCNGGDKTLAELETANGGPFRTVTARSGGGGVHLFFAVAPDSRLRNGRGIRPGFDRRGNGGYVVCAPSLHSSGQRYAWVAGLGLGSHALPVPEWLDEPEIERGEPVEVPLVLPVNLSSRDLARIDRYARRALDLESNAVRTAPKGTRNARLNEAAFCLGTLVGARALEQALVESVLFGAATAAGLGKRETQATIRSGVTAGIKRPRAVPDRRNMSNATPPMPPTNDSSAPSGSAVSNDSTAANDNQADWEPTYEDPISGFPNLSKISISLRADYIELAKRPIQYVWQDILVAGTVGLVAGPPGGGKTTLAFLYAGARASRNAIELVGRSVYPAHPKQRLVLIEAEHSEASAARKLLASLRLLGIDDNVLESRRVITVARKAVRLASPAWREVVSMMAAGLVSDVIVDTLARFAPADANDEQEQVEIYDSLAVAIECCRDKQLQPPTCLLVAHTRKGADGESIESVSGSTQRVGQTDTLLLAEATRENGRVISTRVTVPKLREDPGERWPLPYSFSIRSGELFQEPSPSKKSQQHRETEDEELALQLAQIVMGSPKLGSVALRRLATEKLGWGIATFRRAEARLKDGAGGMRLVDACPKSNVCEWVIARGSEVGT